MSLNRSLQAARGALLGSLVLLLGMAGSASASDPGYSFHQAGSYPTRNVDLQVADLDGDGADDVVTYGAGATQVRLGRATGLGRAKRVSGPTVKALQLVDLNGDDVLDIATAGPVMTLIGDGEGGFSRAAGPIRGGTEIEVGGLTRGGGRDLLVLDENGVTLFPGDGAGGLEAPIKVPVAFNGEDDGVYEELKVFAVGDINEDRKSDIVIVAHDDVIRHGTPLFTLLGDGFGEFEQVNHDLGGPISGAESVTLRDFDSDGHLDLFSTDTVVVQGGFSALHYGNGDGTFARQSKKAPSFSGARRPAIADFNADGRLDIAATTSDQIDSFGISVALGGADRNFGPVAREMGVAESYVWSGLEPGRLGGTRLPDLAVIRSDEWADSASRKLEIHLGERRAKRRP